MNRGEIVRRALLAQEAIWPAKDVWRHYGYDGFLLHKLGLIEDGKVNRITLEKEVLRQHKHWSTKIFALRIKVTVNTVLNLLHYPDLPCRVPTNCHGMFISGNQIKGWVYEIAGQPNPRQYELHRCLRRYVRGFPIDPLLDAAWVQNHVQGDLLVETKTSRLAAYANNYCMITGKPVNNFGSYKLRSVGRFGTDRVSKSIDPAKFYLIEPYIVG